MKEITIKIYEDYYNLLLKISKKEKVEFNDLINSFIFFALLGYADAIEERDNIKQDKQIAKIKKAIKSSTILWGF